MGTDIIVSGTKRPSLLVALGIVEDKEKHEKQGPRAPGPKSDGSLGRFLGCPKRFPYHAAMLLSPK